MSDSIRSWACLREMLYYKCNQRCINSVNFKKHIQNNSIHCQLSHGGSRSANKQKLGKCNDETKKAHNVKECKFKGLTKFRQINVHIEHDCE